MKKDTLTPVSDYELVRRFRSGDQTAFEAIVHKYSRSLSISIFNMTKDVMISEDILQETFLKAIESIRKGGFQETGSLGGWLSIIAKNICINYFRSKRYKVETSLTIVHEGVDDDTAGINGFARNPEEITITDESIVLIRGIFAGLPKLYREPLILFVFEQLKYREIAERLSINLNTVKTRIRIARIMMKSELILNKQKDERLLFA